MFQETKTEEVSGKLIALIVGIVVILIIYFAASTSFAEKERVKASPIKVGDIVKTKLNNSPEMIVTLVSCESKCRMNVGWFDKNNILRTSTIDAEYLIK